MSDPVQAKISGLMARSETNVAAFLDEMRSWSDGFVSASAFLVATANWDSVRNLALQDWLKCLEDPSPEALENNLPVLGFYLAAAHHDPLFVASILQGCRRDEETRDALFGDVMMQDGPALLALMARESEESIKLLEEACVPDPRMDPSYGILPYEALALLVELGVYRRAALDEKLRAMIDVVYPSTWEDRNERMQWLVMLLLECGPGVFLEEAKQWYKPPNGIQLSGLMNIVDGTELESLPNDEERLDRWHSWGSLQKIASDTRLAMEWMDHRTSTFPSESDDYDEGVEKLVDSYDNISAPAEGPKIGRNDPCPCGSGKKFKKCCGNPAVGLN